jgi:hypothetical protein
MGLLELSDEIILQILAPLEIDGDSESLCSVCLVGNHRLSSIARPLSLSTVKFSWDGDRLWNHDLVKLIQSGHQDEQQAQLENYVADPDHIRWARALEFMMYGEYDFRSLSTSFYTSIQKFSNVTHLTLCTMGCQSAPYDPDYTTQYGSMATLSLLLKALPRPLTSLHLEGMAQELERETSPVAYNWSAPSLRHLSVFFCSLKQSALKSLWLSCLDLEVAEFKTGDYVAYWDNHPNPTGQIDGENLFPAVQSIPLQRLFSRSIGRKCRNRL